MHLDGVDETDKKKKLVLASSKYPSFCYVAGRKLQAYASPIIVCIVDWIFHSYVTNARLHMI